MDEKVRRGIWRLADPKISLASFAGLFLAACMAAADSGLHPLWLAVTVVGIFAVEVAKNAYGEIVDYASGTDQAVAPADRSPFSGGKRVIVDGLLTPEQAGGIAGWCYGLAMVSGLVIVWLREPRVLSIGLIGMTLAWYYHGGSLRLAYRGLGELAVAICYGPLIVCGCYLVQVGALSPQVIEVSVALGVLVAGFLWINQFPDYLADRACGKNNLVVALGRERAAVAYVAILTTGYLVLGLTAFERPGSGGLLWGMLGAPPALYSAWRVIQNTTDTARLIPAQVACLASFVLMALGAGLGYLLSDPW